MARLVDDALAVGRKQQPTPSLVVLAERALNRHHAIARHGAPQGPQRQEAATPPRQALPEPA